MDLINHSFFISSFQPMFSWQIQAPQHIRPSCGKQRSKLSEMWSARYRSPGLVSLHWCSWGQNANKMSWNKTLWYACVRLAEWKAPVCRRWYSKPWGLLSLVKKLLSMEKQDKCEELQCILFVWAAKTTCVLTSILRWVFSFLGSKFAWKVRCYVMNKKPSNGTVFHWFTCEVTLLSLTFS